MSSTEELKQQILEIVRSRKETYGRVLVQSALSKYNGKWRNMVTKIVPLLAKDSPRQLRKWDYGNFAIIESLISLEKFESFVSNLSANCEASFSIEGYDIESPPGSLSNGYEHDSAEDYLNIGWSFKRFHFSANITVSHHGPLISPEFPVFRDAYNAISKVLGVDRSRGDSSGILICLPSYYARIRGVTIGANELSVAIEPKEVSINDVIGKCYCESGEQIKHEDIEFSDSQGRVYIGFRPETAYIAIISKSKNEMLDKREFHSSWRLPKDIIIDIPEFEIKQLIEQGESDTVEFKRQIESRPGDVNRFVESVVAFANSKGGVILLGVDDSTQIQGISDKDSEERVSDVIRSHCIPEPKFECIRRQIGENKIIVIRVEEGSDKPYTVWQKGVFIRAGSSSRVAERYELDEIYRPKTASTYSSF